MKKIITVFVVLLVVGSAFGAIYCGFNAIAKIFIDIDEPEHGLETLTSIDGGVTWRDSASINASSGEIIEILLKHTNYRDYDVNGNISFDISCTDGLMWGTGHNTGIYDFRRKYFDNPDLCGLAFKYIDDVTATPVNNETYLTKQHDMSAVLDTSKKHVFETGIEYESKLIITLNDNAYGDYVFSGYVVER